MELSMRLLLLLIMLAWTQTSSVRAGDCGDTMNQLAMNECANRAFQKADAELNDLYRDFERRVTDPQSQKLLTAAERAWVTFRDAECTFSTASSTGGSVHPMAFSVCLERLTAARIGDFKRYLQCDEGDLSCPFPAK
jgi:uncharacterized protein YecT (DUF1311 family)